VGEFPTKDCLTSELSYRQYRGPESALWVMMKEDKDEVLVYRYVYWDEANQAHVNSETFATLETIRKGLGTPIHTASQKVQRLEVVNGIYTPKREKA
jgi:hypothetical protein